MACGRVECVACLDDEMPSSRTAKLKCGHRMCHGCMKRVFKVSIKDPAHMPPKCCTGDPIPVKHVDRLFDMNFKKTWNQKFAEYSTQNRIYCPSRKCGEWIKPDRIHKFKDGRKQARCGNCKTEVCCVCNGKWHRSRDCPRDEATSEILRQAKENGWQRCYSCKTMVELKEGCNHMICRCGSEFCMICGAKWKSCECPWFNYDQLDEDRLDHHMQIPVDVRVGYDRPSPRELRAAPRSGVSVRSRTSAYDGGLQSRRRHEHDHHDVSRRMQYDEDDDLEDEFVDKYGDVVGIGNAAGHFMNEDYRRAPSTYIAPQVPSPPLPSYERPGAGDYVAGVNRARGVRGSSLERRLADRFSELRTSSSPIHRSYTMPIPPPMSMPPVMGVGGPPPPPPPPSGASFLRRHTMEDEFYSPSTRSRLTDRITPRHDMPRDSVLAGLTGPGSGMNRVHEWRTYVAPGGPDVDAVAVAPTTCHNVIAQRSIEHNPLSYLRLSPRSGTAAAALALSQARQSSRLCHVGFSCSEVCFLPNQQLRGVHEPSHNTQTMLLLHQIGSVKIGELVRYTVTYTPSHDRILPSPEVLHLRIRNTSAVALRAAFVHGPYTLNVAAYPAHYDPNVKFANPRKYGVPEFEPMLKAGGSWSCQLIVPEDIRQNAGLGSGLAHFGANAGPGATDDGSVSWVIEVTSQVIFSASAAVGYEVILARDEKSLSLGGSTPVIGGQAQVPLPGKVSDFQQSIGARDGHHPAQLRGVFSRAVRLKVEDTASLWNTPRLPDGGEILVEGAPANSGQEAAVDPVRPPKSAGSGSAETTQEIDDDASAKGAKPPKFHLVVLTHGLHSNLGADMLYLKESIDASVKQAKIDAKARRAKERAEREAKRRSTAESHSDGGESAPAAAPASSDDAANEDDSEDEEVIVRGFSGNATRTERGIKYLGKRLARYVLSMTYPDQPFLPSHKSVSGGISTAFKSDVQKDEVKPAHKHSTILSPKHSERHRAFKISSISFIGHSLGGLIQTYAIAYIQKHSPQFFDSIRPINFITLASPLLGLSNENPLYVKFALDFGLVGRTGQDLGLTWRAPTIARSSWGAIVSTLGESAHKKVMGEVQPESKPLLRILPTGPAHAALKKFRNRTVYSNVVNDGIVPLRTSCLLFLDWQGLGRVEKARREAGLVESVIGFGWAELTGANMTAARGPWTPEEEDRPLTAPPQEELAVSATSSEPDTGHEHSREVPQPASNAIAEDDRQSLNLTVSPFQDQGVPPAQNSQTSYDGPLSGFFNFFKSNEPPKIQGQGPKSPPPGSPKLPKEPKENKIYKRSQTLKIENGGSETSSKSNVTTGHELNNDQQGGMSAPPRTTFFESAGDILNPKLPSVEFLIDPSKRPRTIFHDRVYHPSDIPPPPLKKRSTTTLTLRRKTHSSSSKSQLSNISERHDSTSSSPYRTPDPGVNHQDSALSARDYDDMINTNPERDPDEVIDSSNMGVEEKIARAYHKGLSWRKVLVKLEPDAHNNIIVRRAFANAHGWPVVKHLVDAHFSDAAVARMPDDEEQNVERAKPMSERPDATGAETLSIRGPSEPENDAAELDRGRKGRDSETTVPTLDEHREAQDSVSALPTSPTRPDYDRLDSVTWSERDWVDSADESEGDLEHLGYGGHRDKDGNEREASRGPLSPSWNWTEKIVGKGSSRKRESLELASKSPPMSPSMSRPMSQSQDQEGTTPAS
ncbi:hypothetical protein BX600DRAFT_376022 [Xylariales sp. PMI_506]|nr:hypothetical protein BX600DRAFT_376022 [Xylariales sp. PMI_506]